VNAASGQDARANPRIHHVVQESRRRDEAHPARTVVLSHALGCDLSMWDALADRLAQGWRVVRFDHRGHGASQATAGPCTMADLTDDALRVLDAVGTEPVVWIGLSMGGMVGQELAIRHPGRVSGLVIANSTSHYPPAAVAMWKQRIEAVQHGGTSAIADAVMGRYFHAAFRDAEPATVAAFRARLVATDPAGYVACCHAIAGVDTTARLPQVQVPALVIAGALDEGTPVAMAETLAAVLPRAQLTVLRDASHLSVIEQPAAFAAAVESFLDTLPCR
jgi:3-oxoadipate enol-lactonase